MNQRTDRATFGIRFYCLLSLVAALVILTAGRVGAAADLPDGFSESLVTGGLDNPTSMAFAPDGRLFVLQQGGQARIVKDGALLATPFLSLAVSSQGERGLLGITFDPDFATNQYVYVYYTTTGSPLRNRVSRFTADGDTAAPGSEVVLLELDPLSATNHNGGALHFGTDGKLYVAVGDNAVSSNAQTLTTLHGKMLRLNKDGSIPTDNPFYGEAVGKNRAIWAMGLRNPFTFAVQPGSGDILINDVGQSSWEEINEGSAGANYGWPACEGNCGNPDYVNPIHAYAHSGSVCAITGGAFYNPAVAQFPATYTGRYFFADYCANWIKLLNPANGAVTTFATGLDRPVDLDVGPDGSLYYLARGSDEIYRIEYLVEQAPQINQQPADRTVTEGQAAVFSVGASGSPPISYQWQRDGDDIDGADGASYTLPNASPADDGATFRVRVSNDFGDVLSNAATLTVVANQPPVATITKPATSLRYKAGNKIKYAATAVDAEDGNLPAAAYTWRVDFHHDDHFHPFMPAKTGKRSGTFTIPKTGETAANVWHRIHLTVRDADGAEHSTYHDVLPQTVTLTLTSSPPGLVVTLNGQPHTTPYTFESVVGIRHTLSAPTPQTLGGDEYRFSKWTGGKPRTHTISAPAKNKTYVAAFKAQN